MPKSNSKRKNILYITFLGILEPVAYSQVFSYIVNLSCEKNLRFFLLSFEKNSFIARKDYLKIEDIRRKLLRNNVEWRILRHRRGLAKLYSLFECLFLSVFLILKNKIDIIHARSNEPAIIAFLISKVTRVKVIYDRRGMMGEDYTDDATTSFKIKRGGFIYRLLDRLEKRIMIDSDAIVVLTDRIYRHVIQDKDFSARKGAIHVIPCCVNLDVFYRFRKNNSRLLSDLGLENKFIINYTGSLCDLHSFPEMLNFFKTAKDVIPNAHFMFLTMVEEALLLARIEPSGLDIEDFTIISASPLRVNEYLSICDASIMFFKPTFIRLAASPTKLAECLASGLPVIINKGIGDTEALIEKNTVGVVVEEFSQSAYLAALESLLTLVSEQGLRLRCRKTAESDFPLQLGAERYRKIYKAL